MNLIPISPEAAWQKVPAAIARFERWLIARRIEAELLAGSDEEEPGYTPDPEPMPAKAPRAMLAPTRAQRAPEVENGYITGQPTVKRTQKPGPKAEPKATRRYNKKGPRR